MSVPMPNDEDRRIEYLLTLTARITDALSADIAALESGKFQSLRSTDPEVERLCALYGREVAGLKAAGGVKARSDKAKLLRKTAAQLNELLARHQNLVTAMRNASEGIVQAVAKEVQKNRESAAPYRPVPKAKPVSTGAIVYNRVI